MSSNYSMIIISRCHPHTIPPRAPFEFGHPASKRNASSAIRMVPQSESAGQEGFKGDRDISYCKCLLQPKMKMKHLSKRTIIHSTKQTYNNNNNNNNNHAHIIKTINSNTHKQTHVGTTNPHCFVRWQVIEMGPR